MPETAAQTLSQELVVLAGVVSQEYHELERATTSLTEAVKKLQNQRVRAVPIEGFTNYSDSGVFSKNPGDERSVWSDRYNKYSKYERVPLVGVVVRYEISPTGSVELIIIVPGDNKNVYKIRARYYELEILDEFPQPDESHKSPSASKVTVKGRRGGSGTSAD